MAGCKISVMSGAFNSSTKSFLLNRNSKPSLSMVTVALRLLSETSASVTMLSDGLLLRLSKKDFVELLKAPLITQISLKDASEKVSSGAIWLDVRFPSEYKYDSLPSAINVPLNELRANLEKLDKQKEYICYCQTGRRSSAAAFILIGYGFNVLVLEGGTRLGRI